MNDPCYYCCGGGYLQRIPKKEHGSRVKCLVCDGTGRATREKMKAEDTAEIDEQIRQAWEQLYPKYYGIPTPKNWRISDLDRAIFRAGCEQREIETIPLADLLLEHEKIGMQTVVDFVSGHFLPAHEYIWYQDGESQSYLHNTDDCFACKYEAQLIKWGLKEAK